MGTAAGCCSTSFDDGGVILRKGGRAWQLILFGLAAAPLGLWLINGLGPSFGLAPKSDPARGRVDPRAAVGVALALVALVIAEIALGN